MKVNLSAVRSRIVGRGRKAYENPALEAELASLNPNDPDEAIVWDEAQTPEGLSQDEKVSHRAKFRGRAESVATRLGVTISVGWLDDGQMLISLRQKAKKRK